MGGRPHALCRILIGYSSIIACVPLRRDVRQFFIVGTPEFWCAHGLRRGDDDHHEHYTRACRYSSFVAQAAPSMDKRGTLAGTPLFAKFAVATPCAEPGCLQPVFVRRHGLCRRHYKDMQRLHAQAPVPGSGTGRACAQARCIHRVYCRGLCRKHYQRAWFRGALTPLTVGGDSTSAAVAQSLFGSEDWSTSASSSSPVTSASCDEASLASCDVSTAATSENWCALVYTVLPAASPLQPQSLWDVAARTATAETTPQ